MFSQHRADAVDAVVHPEERDAHPFLYVALQLAGELFLDLGGDALVGDRGGII